MQALLVKLSMSEPLLVNSLLSSAYGLRAHVHVQIYTTFYCRQNEPSYIKSLKLDILAAIADETNAFEIATELTEYVNDIDEQLARNAVKAVGRIAIEVSSMHHSGSHSAGHGRTRCTAPAMSTGRLPPLTSWHRPALPVRSLHEM